ncbi:MAG: TrkH family potassium uptake protein [Candidatus Omnitrophota bacterium]
MGRLNPPQLLIISFICAILAGTALLSLPLSTEGPGRIKLVDSLFTATSAVCVTGLVVKDTGSQFAPFGKWVIFALFQAGGLGIMTFSTLFAVLLGRRIGLRESDAIRSSLDRQNIVGLRKLISYILAITVTMEAIAAACLFFRWRAITDWGVFETLENAVFHSVSGFCNAGFSLFRSSLEKFQADPVINIVMMAVIFTGGIGFVVIMDVIGMVLRKSPLSKLSLQSKIALLMSFALIIGGAVLLLLLEKDHVMRMMSWPERVWGALFQSVTARTAGFNTLPIGKMAAPSLLILIFLMFIGASPGSTGGGIKTCTFAVVVATVYSMFTNRRRTMILDRSLPKQVIREALVIFFLAVTWIFVMTVLVAYFEGRSLRGSAPLLKSMFEVVSAFGTVGLSTGITEYLSDESKVCLIITMFAGRLGPLTLALAVAFRDKKEKFIFPEENVMVG